MVRGQEWLPKTNSLAFGDLQSFLSARSERKVCAARFSFLWSDEMLDLVANGFETESAAGERTLDGSLPNLQQSKEQMFRANEVMPHPPGFRPRCLEQFL